MIQESAKAAHPGGDGDLHVEQLGGELGDSNTPASPVAQAAVDLNDLPPDARLNFDYRDVHPDIVSQIKRSVFFIRIRLGSTQRTIVEIGAELLKVKETLGHGRFGKWIAAEFSMSDQTARRFMHVAEKFGKSNTVLNLDFAPSALYELAAPSTADEVIAAAVDAQHAGHTVTRDDVLELKKSAAHPERRRALKLVAKECRFEDQTARHIDRQRKLEKIAEHNPEPPTGRLFSCVSIDVPRHHDLYSDNSGSEKAPENHFPTMSFEDLFGRTGGFDVNRFAASDAIIAYWSTAASYLDDHEILAEWCFVAFRPRDEHGKLRRDADGKAMPPAGGGRYGSHQVWRKQRQGRQKGMGRWFRNQHEVLIVARRGNPPAPLPGTQADSVFDAPVGKHSAKPNEQVRDWVDRCWPHIEKVEVFSRETRARPKWTFWGNETQPAGAPSPSSPTSASAEIATANGTIADLIENVPATEDFLDPRRGSFAGIQIAGSKLRSGNDGRQK